MIADEQLAVIEQRCRELIAFADGVEEAGWPAYARRARVVADDAINLVYAVAAERSVRRSLQHQHAEALRRLASPAAGDGERR